MFDIIVVGAKQSGATFARLANRNLKILVIDKGMQKCCGGLIAPDAQKTLARFDMGIPKRMVSDPQLFYVKAIDLKTKREAKYQRHYTNINRHILDEYLIQKMPENVEFKSNCRYISHREEKNTVIVSIIEKFEGHSKQTEYSCKLLVGADGANSLIRKSLYNDFASLRKYIAIQGEYNLNKPINHFGVFFDSNISNFYSWLIPKGNKVLLGGAFAVKEKPNRKYRMLVEKVISYGYDINQDTEKLDACFLLRPKLKDIKVGKGRIALIGEAAGFISPSSSEGFSYAYKSAEALANILKDADIKTFKISKYKTATQKLRMRIFLKNIKGFFMYNPLMRNIIFKLGIGSLKL